MPKPWKDHLSASRDLKTTYEAIRAGFVALALEKNRRATPFVAEARALKSTASCAKCASDLLEFEKIQPALLTAAGVSEKASTHLMEADKRAAIDGLIKGYLEPARTQFVEELVFRFLLTRGDALGGAMRNFGGFMATKLFTRSIVGELHMARTKCQWRHAVMKTWADLAEDDADAENNLRGLSWVADGRPRTLIYNLQVPLVRNNVDLCLFLCRPQEITPELLKNPAAYVALGELKGGIDPAGADEHWKTGRSALNRIRAAFAKHRRRPHLFFIGAAIETKMADEIWQMLRRGELANAANLTDEDQMAAVARWLCSL